MNQRKDVSTSIDQPAPLDWEPMISPRRNRDDVTADRSRRPLAFFLRRDRLDVCAGGACGVWAHPRHAGLLPFCLCCREWKLRPCAQGQPSRLAYVHPMSGGRCIRPSDASEDWDDRHRSHNITCAPDANHPNPSRPRKGFDRVNLRHEAGRLTPISRNTLRRRPQPTLTLSPGLV